MRRTWVVILGLGLLAARTGAEEARVLETPKEKASYAVGVDTARSLRQQGIEVDLDVLIRGLTDELSGRKLLMTERDLRAAGNAARNEAMRKQAAQRQKTAKARAMSGEDNRKAGEAFLAENRTKDGVVVLPSGLQYKVLEAGDGRKPADSDVVQCDYRGTLIDGTVFDSSYARGTPTAFRVAGVIPGWREALKLMPVGSRWRLFIPPGLAYGEKGAGRHVGPNATLIFDLELLAIE